MVMFAIVRDWFAAAMAKTHPLLPVQVFALKAGSATRTVPLIEVPVTLGPLYATPVARETMEPQEVAEVIAVLNLYTPAGINNCGHTPRKAVASAQAELIAAAESEGTQ